SRSMAEAAEIVSGDLHGGRGRSRYVDDGEIRRRQSRGAAPPRRQRHALEAVLARDPGCLLRRGAAALCRGAGAQSQIQEGVRILEQVPRGGASLVPRRGAAVRQLHALAPRGDEEELSRALNVAIRKAPLMRGFSFVVPSLRYFVMSIVGISSSDGSWI